MPPEQAAKYLQRHTNILSPWRDDFRFTRIVKHLEIDQLLENVSNIVTQSSPIASVESCPTDQPSDFAHQIPPEDSHMGRLSKLVGRID